MEITTGKKIRGKFVVLYGAPGIGKTTLASKSTNPLFIDAESGTDELDVARLSIKAPEQVREAFVAAFKSEYKTIIIDSATAIERLLTAKILSERNIKTLARAGFGAGFQDLKDSWIETLKPIDAILQSNRNVILIGHTKVKAVNDPVLGDSYDRTEMDIHKDSLQTIVSAADMMLLMREEITLKDDEGRTRPVGTGKRVLYTADRPSFLAKTRVKMPDIVDLEKTPEFWEKLGI
jgi:Cdc6-like AAA superfamily ATPase